MNPNFKKKKPLPYKNLGELYIEAVQGEPSINRLPIVENGSVLITRDGVPEDALYQDVSDDNLNRIDVILNEEEIVKKIDEAIGRQFVNRPESKSYLNLAVSLREAIKTSGSVKEIEAFCKAYMSGTEFINIEKLTTSSIKPLEINNFITDSFAQKALTTPGDKPLNIDTLLQNVFKYLFINLPAGKSDAGPGEGALVALSPNISYAEKGDIYIKDYGKVEVKAARELGGRGGRVWDSVVDQSGMVTALQKIFPQHPGKWKVTVIAGAAKGDKNSLIPRSLQNDLQNDPARMVLYREFITAACKAWFGGEKEDVIKSFGTEAFTKLWLKQIFNTYKTDKKFVGLLSLGLTKYHYATTEAEFVEMEFSNKGYICNTDSNQGRDLAPQLQIY